MSINAAKDLDIGYLPQTRQDRLRESYDKALATMEQAAGVREAEAALAQYAHQYRPLHREVRRLQSDARALVRELEERHKELTRLTRSGAAEVELDEVRKRIKAHETEKQTLDNLIPDEWESAREDYMTLANAEKRVRLAYRDNVDEAYQAIAELQRVIGQSEALEAIGDELAALGPVIADQPAAPAMAAIKLVERRLGDVGGTSAIKTKLSKARRALKGNAPNLEKAIMLLVQARAIYTDEVGWRNRASSELVAGLDEYDQAIRDSIGLRQQRWLSVAQAKEIASCQAVHRDVSLNF